MMVQIPDQATPTDEPGDARTASDRRRPGRIDTVNPALLPLLRQDSLLAAALSQRDSDDLAPVRGIALSVLCGVLLWAALALALYWVFAG
jgi:hypothetical protein